MRWDEGLAGDALRIAATDNSPVWVAAGPGTGKTFALMRRLARLLEITNVDPKRILVCTFTRTAAGDLARAVEKLGIAGAADVQAQTVHGLCFSMLWRQEVLHVTGRVPRPLLQCEERFLFEDLCHDGLGGVRACGKTLRAFSAAWARLQHDEPGWPTDDSDRAFQLALTAWLQFHSAMLIGELIPEALRYLRLNPISPYRTAFDHVLVDEYQDLNRAEQNLVDLLSNGSLVVIGDEDQSIYSFKYAHPEGIVEFPQTHTNTEIAQLDQCRRCPQRIVDIANSLIQNNTTRSNRLLRSSPSNPKGDVLSVQWTDMEQEATGLARFVKSRVDLQAVLPGNVLVLAPRREFGYLVRDELRRVGIASHSFFSEEIIEGDPKDFVKCRAQQALALLILLANPDDRVALRCWCGFGNNTLRANGWARLRAHCDSNGESPWEALEQLEASTVNIPYTAPLVDRFRILKTELARLVGLRGNDLISAVFPSDEEWARPFTELNQYIDNDEFRAADLVDVIRRHITQPELPVNVDYVRVMSLHKSTGLTADMVIVVGCLEGLMPYVDYMADPSEQLRSLEEQRRLFYVAITRTTQVLVLSSVAALPTDLAHRMRARVGRAYGGNSATMTSRFVAELGSECPSLISGYDCLRVTVGS